MATKKFYRHHNLIIVASELQSQLYSTTSSFDEHRTVSSETEIKEIYQTVNAAKRRSRQLQNALWTHETE